MTIVPRSETLTKELLGHWLLVFRKSRNKIVNFIGMLNRLLWCHYHNVLPPTNIARLGAWSNDSPAALCCPWKLSLWSNDRGWMTMGQNVPAASLVNVDKEYLSDERDAFDSASIWWMNLRYKQNERKLITVNADQCQYRTQDESTRSAQSNWNLLGEQITIWLWVSHQLMAKLNVIVLGTQPWRNIWKRWGRCYCIERQILASSLCRPWCELFLSVDVFFVSSIRQWTLLAIILNK